MTTTAKRSNHLRKADGTSPGAPTAVSRPHKYVDKKVGAGGKAEYEYAPKPGEGAGAPRLSAQIAAGKPVTPPGATQVQRSGGLGPVQANMNAQGTGINKPAGQQMQRTGNGPGPNPDHLTARAEQASNAAASANSPEAEMKAADAHAQAADAHNDNANKIEGKHHEQMAQMHRRVASIMQAQAPSASPPAGGAPSAPAQGGGTVAGRKNSDPSMRGQAPPEKDAPSDFNEPADGGNSKDIAENVVKTGNVGTTKSGLNIELGMDTKGMKPNDLNEASQLHRAAQQHLLEAAKATGDAKYKNAAKKHLDEEFRLASAFADSSEHKPSDIGGAMTKSRRTGYFRPVWQWASFPESFMRSDMFKSLDPFQALEVLEKAVKADSRQADMFGGAAPQTDPAKPPTAAGSVHNAPAAPASAAPHAAGKHGEGSRGGHVIGHTTSGKPIYASHSNPAHAGFNSTEHHEAAEVHRKIQIGNGVRDVAGKDVAHHEKQQRAHMSTGAALFDQEKSEKAISSSKRAFESSQHANASGEAKDHRMAFARHKDAAIHQRAAGHHDIAHSHDKIADEHAAKGKGLDNASYDKSKVADEATRQANMKGTAAAHQKAATAHHAAAASHTDTQMKRAHFLNAKGHEEAIEKIPQRGPGNDSAMSDKEMVAEAVKVQKKRDAKKPKEATTTRGYKAQARVEQRKKEAAKAAKDITREAHAASAKARLGDVTTYHHAAAAAHTKAADAHAAVGDSISENEHREHAAIHQKKVDADSAANIEWQKKHPLTGKKDVEITSPGYHPAEPDEKMVSHLKTKRHHAAADAVFKQGGSYQEAYKAARAAGASEDEGHRAAAAGRDANDPKAQAAAASTAASETMRMHNEVRKLDPKKMTKPEHFERAHAKIKALADHIHSKLGAHPAHALASKAADRSGAAMDVMKRKVQDRGLARDLLDDAKAHAEKGVEAMPSNLKKSTRDDLDDMMKAFTPPMSGGSTSGDAPYKPKPAKKAKRSKFGLKKPSETGATDPRRTAGLSRYHAPNLTRSNADEIDDLVKASHTETTKMKTETLQPKKGNKKAGKKAKVKGGARGTVSSDPKAPGPGKTEHLNPMSVQGALTKSDVVHPSSVDALAAASAAAGGVTDRWRHQPRLHRPRFVEFDCNNLPARTTPAPERMEKSEAVKHAALAVDHALKNSYTQLAAQTNAGSPASELLLKSVMPGRMPAWTPDQRRAMAPPMIEPDGHLVVKNAAVLLKSLAAVDEDARAGLEELGVSEQSLMDRFSTMNLNLENVVFG